MHFKFIELWQTIQMKMIREKYIRNAFQVHWTSIVGWGLPSRRLPMSNKRLKLMFKLISTNLFGLWRKCVQAGPDRKCLAAEIPSSVSATGRGWNILAYPGARRCWRHRTGRFHNPVDFQGTRCIWCTLYHPDFWSLWLLWSGYLVWRSSQAQAWLQDGMQPTEPGQGAREKQKRFRFSPQQLKTSFLLRASFWTELNWTRTGRKKKEARTRPTVIFVRVAN